MKDNDVWQEEYSSATAKKTEENDCLDRLPDNNERCRKSYA